MIALILLSIVTTGAAVYFGYRAYILAGILADTDELIDSVQQTNEYMYARIQQSYDAMQKIDRIGAFEKDDEAGTTFELLKQVIEELKEEFDGQES
jgi:hypothetical protein